MSSVYYVKQGDTAPAAMAILLDPSGNPQSLAGAVVRFHMVTQERQVKVDALAVIDPDQVVNPGKVTYQWLVGDTDDVGVYLAEWEVTFSGGAVQTYPNSEYDSVRIDAELV